MVKDVEGIAFSWSNCGVWTNRDTAGERTMVIEKERKDEHSFASVSLVKRDRRRT